MYISELRIQGFKSFAKKEVLNLGKGITSIVGPNGCGKTNIVDAIRWVLGEQKTSTLRGSKMEDVIFNGAENMKPLSVCDVSLTVHNNRGLLPVEYDDVEIGRRLYRNGDSEYFLNRTPCRLKDIHDLFIDTGMGSDAYSVIELKMIEEILSESGDDRRRMFEEAAGINKYKSQRRSALRKFEATKADLERINDIVHEVEQKVHGLALQLKRYKRHEKLSLQVEEKELTFAGIKILRYKELLKPLQKRIKDTQHLRDSTTTRESIHEQELKKLRSVYQEQESELDQLRKELGGLETDRDRHRHAGLVATEKTRAARATIDRLILERGSATRKTDQLKIHIKDYDEEIRSMEPRIDEKLQSYKSRKEKFEHVESAYKKALDDLERIQARRWEEQRKLADQRSLVDRTQSMIGEKTDRIRRLEEKSAELESSQEKHSKEQKALEDKKTLAQTALDSNRADLEKLEKKLTRLQADRHDLTLEYHFTLTQVEALESQLQFYRELIETREGYPDGVRYILKNKKKFPGTLGTVGDLFHVEEIHQGAIVMGLGDLAHCLVTRDRVAALKILDKIRQAEMGELTLLPLKEAVALKSPERTIPKHSGIIGRASSLVATGKELKPLAQLLLGNLLIVKDVQEVLDEPWASEWDLADTNGIYIGRDLLVKSRRGSDQSSVLGRQKKVESLDNEIEKLVEKAQHQKARQSELDQQITDLEKENESQSNLVDSLIQDLSQVETEIIRNHYRQSQVLEAIQEATRELADTRKELHQLTDSADALSPKLQVGEALQETLSMKLEMANETVTETRTERDSFSQSVQDIRIELLELENQRDNLEFQKRTAEETIVELGHRQKEISTEIQSLENDSLELEKQIEEADAALKKVNAKIQHQRSILELKQQSYSETYASLEEIQTRIRNEQRDREALLEELKQAELESADTSQKIRMVAERIQDRYGKTVPDPGQVDISEDDLSLEIERMERSLASIGPVNMAVQGEYEEEQARLNLLNEQRDDLVSAEENLRETIRKIDQVARKQFQETFDRIKVNFEKLFTLFFEGGKASLELVGDPDPLDADISIKAQPPGKRNQSLRMLSAGEKALTAISLLFAIYQVKPSPYCILDEVDAPLDDVNIRKFTKILQTFAKDTQFIVVTHNKLTMEEANYLYGVTMEKKGVSKLVSVRFDD